MCLPNRENCNHCKVLNTLGAPECAYVYKKIERVFIKRTGKNNSFFRKYIQEGILGEVTHI